MALWRVAVSTREDLPDAAGEAVRRDISDLGIPGAESVRYSQVYYVEGDVNEEQLDIIARELLSDPVSQTYRYHARNQSAHGTDWLIEVRYREGVTDAVADTALKGICDLGISGATSVRTAREYVLRGRLLRQEVETICAKLLANRLIEQWTITGS